MEVLPRTESRTNTRRKSRTVGFEFSDSCVKKGLLEYPVGGLHIFLPFT